MKTVSIIKNLLFTSTLCLTGITNVHATDLSDKKHYDTASIKKAVENELHTIIDESSFPGITISIGMPDGTIIDIAIGYSDVEEKIGMQPEHVMLAGSVGKTFVAATILQIAKEHSIDLDAPLIQYLSDHAWFQGMPNADTISLRMLLNHTSGIVASHISAPSIFPIFEQTFGPKGKSMSELGYENIDSAEAIKATSASFPAGSGWAYSDANYIVASLFIEDICECLVFDQAMKRFITPLRLDETRPSPRDSDKYAAGYELEAGILPGAPKKLTESGHLYYDPALEWAGGGFASTSHDLVRWAGALYSAKAISSIQLNEMIQSVSDDIPQQLGWKYGMGVQVANDSHGLRLMHGGYIPGYSTYIEHQPESNMSMAFQINTRSGFGANRKIADRIWAVATEALGKPVPPN